jgi:hypothetical protein
MTGHYVNTEMVDDGIARSTYTSVAWGTVR